MRGARVAGVGNRQRIVEEDEDAVAGETVDRAFVLGDERTHRRVIVAQHRFHFLRLGGVGERGEAAQVDEHVADLAPVRREDRLLAGRQDRVGDGGREEALQLAHALELGDLLGDALLELRVPLLQRVGLAPHLVLQRLDAQQRAHAREELGLVDRLRQEIVGAGLDALDALLLRIERGDEDDGQQRGAGIGRGSGGTRRSRTGPAS